MDRYDGELQVLTHIMLQNSKDADFVGCALVLELIKQVRQELNDAVIPELSITKLKTMRLGSDRQHEDQQSPSQIIAPIFEEIGEYEVKRLQEHYNCVIRRKLGFYREFITDQEVLDDLDGFLTNLTPLETAISEEVELLIDAHTRLNIRCE